MNADRKSSQDGPVTCLVNNQPLLTYGDGTRRILPARLRLPSPLARDLSLTCLFKCSRSTSSMGSGSLNLTRPISLAWLCLLHLIASWMLRPRLGFHPVSPLTPDEGLRCGHRTMGEGCVGAFTSPLASFLLRRRALKPPVSFTKEGIR
jgi:hypothetical protein